jgi:FAD/FMN-containing dehydrogenase
MHHDPYFYPLDRIHDWNRLYGRRGFQQFQCVIPDAKAETGIAALLQAVARSGRASFLTVLKRCGDIPSPGLLSFPVRGISLAIDFPQSPQLETGLLPELDRIVHENDGRLYPAKDAHMTAKHFQAAYPAWRDVERLRDPALMSAFWKRVTA